MFVKTIVIRRSLAKDEDKYHDKNKLNDFSAMKYSSYEAQSVIAPTSRSILC